MADCKCRQCGRTLLPTEAEQPCPQCGSVDRENMVDEPVGAAEVPATWTGLANRPEPSVRTAHGRGRWVAVALVAVGLGLLTIPVARLSRDPGAKRLAEAADW